MRIIDCKNRAVPCRVGVVVSRFNEEVTTKLLDGALERLKEKDVTGVTVVWVPGAVEIPIVCQRLALQRCYDVLITLGAVIRGETTHYDYVCSYVTEGVQRVSHDQNLPIVFGVLTTENEEQAFDRLGGNHGHKGRDAADTALEMVAVLREIAQKSE